MGEALVRKEQPAQAPGASFEKRRTTYVPGVGKERLVVGGEGGGDRFRCMQNSSFYIPPSGGVRRRRRGREGL